MTQSFDVAIIGGGVVGLAILRRFAMSGLSCILLERGDDILSGASKGNSALLHTGFDAPSNSLELACMQSGYREYLEIRQALNLPLLETSALVVAWNEEEEAKLSEIAAKAQANGVSDVRVIDANALHAREQNLSGKARAAVLVPGEHVIDPWSAPLAYARQAIAHGAKINRKTEVTGGRRDKDLWTLQTTSGDVCARTVVNAAGNFGDIVETIVRKAPFHIRPRKGQFVVFDKDAAEKVKAIILPVPTERTKGVVLFRTIFGNLAIGPTAEDQDDRETATCDQTALEALRARAIEMVPSLAAANVNAIYAGLRPASDRKEYIIEALADHGWITASGIRSTGLTACLGIAQHVAGLYAQHLGTLKDAKPIWTPVPNLAEHRERPYQSGGEIVCHCERVTRAEIDAALVGPLPAISMAGLKRRTRAAMGRCQGFYCSAHVAAILREAQDGTS